MRTKLLSAVAALTLLAANLGLAGAAEPDTGHCDRQCLIHHADDYMAALTAHDPSRLSLAPHVRFTEDGVVLKLGDGLWGTFSSIGDYRNYFTDPQTGNVVLFANIDEHGLPSILTLRLKVESGRVSEIESWITRPDKSRTSIFGAQHYAVAADPVWAQVVPSAERSNRARLEQIVGSYFHGIEHNTGKGIPFASDARRFENGLPTTSGQPGRFVMKGPEGTVDVGAMSIQQ
jgi:hypothetical protein